MSSNSFRVPEIESSEFLSQLQKDERGFETLAKRLKDMAGIDLPKNPKNITLMATRLMSVLKKQGFRNYAEYLHVLETGNSEANSEFICSLTTNTTQFFREAEHFNVLRSHFHELYKSKPASEFRVWCAASSSGQEPFTILMNLAEEMPSLLDVHNPGVRMLASDIDIDILNQASEARYRLQEIEGVPQGIRQKYFLNEIDRGERYARVRPELRKRVTFATFNLMTENYPFKHPFDVVFCRNVLIYFNRETTNQVILKLAKTLRPGGLLFLGHSEAGMVRYPDLEMISHAVYRKKGSKK